MSYPDNHEVVSSYSFQIYHPKCSCLITLNDIISVVVMEKERKGSTVNFWPLLEHFDLLEIRKSGRKGNGKQKSDIRTRQILQRILQL